MLVVPSELSVATWQDLLADEDRVEFVTEIDGRIAIVLAAGDYTIHCTPVGLDSTPTNTPTVFPDLDDDPDINPAAPGDIKFVGENFHSKTVTLTLENIGDVHKNISEARINFYHGSTGNIPTQASLRLAGGADVAVLDVGETFETLDPVLLLPAEDSEDIELVFDGNTNNHDWFVLTLVFDSGERGTYFVALR